MNALSRLSLCAAFVVVGALLVNAGDVDPPAGPVAPAMKTLDEVEPRIPLSQETTPGDASNLFLITEPGSYYLTGNLDVPATLNGVGISAPNVTLDLEGFTISNTPGTATWLGSGVTVLFSSDFITIRNGTIQDMDRSAIRLPFSMSGLVV